MGEVDGVPVNAHDYDIVYTRDFDPTQQLFCGAIEVETDTLPRAELISGTRRCKF
jgi:hypothetical protein